MMKDVSLTALTTLSCHAKDARSRKPILNDQSAKQTLKALKKMGLMQAINVPSSRLITHIALRAKHYDDVVREFLLQYPEGNVVNIGCGLDHRFERIDNGQVSFYDLDLPEIISLKSKLFLPSERYKQIGMSVLDHAWMDHITQGPLLILAEGVFMYLKEEDLRLLFDKLGDNFKSFQLFFEVFNSNWLKGWKRKVMKRKLRKSLGFGRGADFAFGVNDSRTFETWNPQLRFVEDWSYLDTKHPSLGALKYFANWEKLRKVQWSVKYNYLTSNDA